MNYFTLSLPTPGGLTRRIISTVAAIFCALPVAAKAVPIDYNGVNLSSAERDVANSMASSSGQHRPFLKIDPTLTAVARSRAKDMANRGYFDHVNPDGLGPNALVRAAGYPLPDSWGNDPKANYLESIAAGYPSSGEVWSAWMKSTPHRTHLLAEDPFYTSETSVGVGYYTSSDSPYVYYWVVISAPPAAQAPLKISTPSSNSRITDPQITVTGITSDDSDTAKVETALENDHGTSPYSTASGVSRWQTNMNLSPGDNIVHVRSRDASGKVIAELARKVHFAQLSPLTVNVTTGGSVSSNFAGTTSRELNKDFTIVATASPGYIFAGWSGSTTASTATLNFTMIEGFTLTASFIPDPFIATSGHYQSLVETNDGAGLLKITSVKKGKFSGKLILNGEKMKFWGRFNADGTAEITIPNSNGLTLSLTMSVNGDGTPLSATLADASSSFTMSLDRDVFNTKSNPAPHVGRYHLVFTPETSQTLAASNNISGTASITINKSGEAIIRGQLSDGSPFKTSSFITDDGHMAVYAKLKKDKGTLAGQLEFTSTSNSVTGDLIWFQGSNSASTTFVHLNASGSAQ